MKIFNPMQKAHQTIQPWVMVAFFGQALGTQGPWAAGGNPGLPGPAPAQKRNHHPWLY